MAKGTTKKSSSGSGAGSSNIIYYNLKLSTDCEKCTDKCEKGLRYLDKMSKKRFGRGVKCPKNK